MTLNVMAEGDNPSGPFAFANTYIPDQLIAGNLKLVTDTVTLGAGTLPRGSVLGQQTVGTITAVAGTNTGNGTCTALAVGPATQPGAYVLKATAPNSFSVTTPDGVALPPATVATPYLDAKLSFTLAAGATAFVVGDSFTVTVAPGTGNYVLSVATATDGSQFPSVILADAADASGGPVNAPVYLQAEVNQNALNYDPSWQLPILKSALRRSQIYVKSAVSAADPS